VQKALDCGFAAATLLPSQSSNDSNDQLRIAFDGDAVLFSDEAEKVFHKKGLKAFEANEKKSADRPLAGGPFCGHCMKSKNPIPKVKVPFVLLS